MTPELQAAADAVRTAIANAEAMKAQLHSDFDCAALVHQKHLRALLAALDPADQPIDQVPTDPEDAPWPN